MILKKPYAFLIKNFKIIHIILSIMIFSIITMFGKISGFFSSYAKENIIGSLGLAAQYINSFLYILIIIIILFSLAMFLLMRRKEKPLLFYVLLFVYYLVLLIMVLIALGVMNSIGEASLTQRSSLAYRDFFIILSLPQYYFLIMSIIRGIGFDVRKFNFTKDLEELEIKNEDDEEFEFVLGTDTYKYQRKLRRIIRELKYYVLENKLVFTVIISTFLSFVFIFFILNFNFLNKVYRVGSTGTVGNLKYKLISAYETKYDYNGQIVSENKKYVILDMIITNNVNSPQTLTNISMYLKAGNNSVYNEPSLRNYFVDFGRTYITDEIQGNTTNRYLLVFELENKTNYKKYYLNILKSIDTKDGITKYNYSKFKIKPEKMISAPVSIERKVNEVMYLGENIFKNSNITFKNIEINSSYQYKYQSCNKKDCRDYYDVIAPSNSASNSLLVLNYKLELSKDIGLKEAIINDKHFFDKFLKIEYNYNNKKMIRSVNAKITSNLENMVFAEIPKTALSSDLLNLIISTRNNTYYIDLTT